MRETDEIGDAVDEIVMPAHGEALFRKAPVQVGKPRRPSRPSAEGLAQMTAGAVAGIDRGRVGAEIADEAQRAAAEAPGHLEAITTQCAVGPEKRRLEERHDFVPAKVQEAADLGARRRMRLARRLVPAQAREREGLLGSRIRDLALAVHLGEGLEMREFPAPPVAHGGRQRRVVGEIDEIQERRRGVPFLAHVEERDLR